MDNIDLAKRLFGALESGDLDGARGLIADDFKGLQNGGPAMDRETLLRFTGAVNAAVPDFGYADPIRMETDTGFVEEHRVRGTLPDGSALDLMVCVVAEVKDGKIAVLREYVDSARAAGLLKAVSPG